MCGECIRCERWERYAESSRERAKDRQTGFQAKQKEARLGFLMLVPGTGHDPVTSCFSDTHKHPKPGGHYTSECAKPQIIPQTDTSFWYVVGGNLPTNIPTTGGAA